MLLCPAEYLLKQTLLSATDDNSDERSKNWVAGWLMNSPADNNEPRGDQSSMFRVSQPGSSTIHLHPAASHLTAGPGVGNQQEGVMGITVQCGGNNSLSK